MYISFSSPINCHPFKYVPFVSYLYDNFNCRMRIMVQRREDKVNLHNFVLSIPFPFNHPSPPSPCGAIVSWGLLFWLALFNCGQRLVWPHIEMLSGCFCRSAVNGFSIWSSRIVTLQHQQTHRGRGRWSAVQSSDYFLSSWKCALYSNDVEFCKIRIIDSAGFIFMLLSPAKLHIFNAEQLPTAVSLWSFHLQTQICNSG